MSESAVYAGLGGGARVETRTLFGQTMGYVAVTAALFAAGAYLGRDLPYGLGFVWFIAAFGCLIGMNFAVRRSRQLTVGLLAAFGLLVGLAMAPVLLYYAGTNPQALWTAGGATALFIVRIPHGSLIYSVLGLVIFAGLTVVDFQRLRRSTDLASAPLIAASIFLDVLNVFLFFLRIFSSGSR